jgi:hypothetical protein
LLNNLPLVRGDQRQAAFGRHAEEELRLSPSLCIRKRQKEMRCVSQTLITGGGLHGKGLIYSRRAHPRRDVVCAKTCLAVFVRTTS